MEERSFQDVFKELRQEKNKSQDAIAREFIIGIYQIVLLRLSLYYNGFKLLSLFWFATFLGN